MYKWTMRVMIGFLIFMACAIIWNVGEYVLDELIEGDVSWTPKSMRK